MTDQITAKAVLYSGNGGYDVISVGDRPVRAPGSGEVRIRVLAATVNPTDILLRDPGQGRVGPPMTPGMDAAGTVEAVGEGVTRLNVGDDVIAAVKPDRDEGGAQASYIVVPEASVVAQPAGTTPMTAATVPMNGLTAIYALDHAALSPGQVLAVTGGAGWLAYLTIVLARQRGLIVLADARPDEADIVRGYGADIVVPRGNGYADRVREAVPHGVDALLDTALLAERVLPAIKEGGVYIPVRGWVDRADEPLVRIRPVLVPEALERTDWLEALREAVEAGRIEPKVAAVYPVEQVADAQRAQLAGGVRGRIVLSF